MEEKIEEEDEIWKFKHPFTARFVGPTACGKTTFLIQVIEKRLVDPWPQNIIYFYGSAWQDGSFDRLKENHGVQFIKGFDETVLESLDSSSSLVICDDLVLEMKDSDSAANLFMRGSHHLNMSVILIEQSLFPKGKQSVAMKQNTHYTVLFKSPSDTLSITTLGRQMFGNRGRFLTEAYHDCTKEPFSYLVIDSKQKTPDALRLVTKVTEQHPIVYLANTRDVNRIIKKFNGQENEPNQSNKKTERGAQDSSSIFD